MTLRLMLPVLAASLAAFPFFSATSKAEPIGRISPPVVHDNIAVYFVRGPSAPGPVPQTLQEALAKGTVEVRETGNVQQLEIENKGAEPVYVQAGDIVKGGQQDRVLTVSLLLPPKSGVVPIGAFCVEQGRWAARGNEDVKKFALSEALMPSREAKVAIARSAAPRTVEPAGAASDGQSGRRVGTATGTPPASRDRAQTQEARRLGGSGPGEGQGEVWRSVGAVQSRLTANLAAPVASDKSETSLQLALENAKLKEAQGAYLAAIEPAGLGDGDIIGVVMAVNGRISSADIYPSNGLFRKMWPKLARASATEALSAKDATDKTAVPAIEAIDAFISDAEAGRASERKLGTVATVEVKDAPKALRTESRAPSGAVLHRNYVAK